MTPKEKAKELVENYTQFTEDIYAESFFNAKQCALIAVDEIIQLRKGYFECTNSMQDESYWQEVKQEIQKL